MGLDPFVHQTLLQIYGSQDNALSISELADRLDIVPAFASRLSRELEERGYVTRRRSESDRRVMRVTATESGIDILRDIDHEVSLRSALFQRQLTDDQRVAALIIFAFMVGLSPDSAVGATLSGQKPPPANDDN